MPLRLLPEKFYPYYALHLCHSYNSNLASRRNIGASITVAKPITKVWTMSLFTNVFNNHLKGIINRAPVDEAYTQAMFTPNNQFKFNEGWGGEISGFFRTKGLESGVMIMEPFVRFHRAHQSRS
jgi:iron complex outermembrane receptor protein